MVWYCVLSVTVFLYSFIYLFNPAVSDTVSVHLMAVCAHVSRVRSLYKRILVLHRFLPIELRALGDEYVKDEFRRHKRAEPKEVKSFMTEWEVRRVTAVQPAAARLLLHFISDITVQVLTVFFICRFSPFYCNRHLVIFAIRINYHPYALLKIIKKRQKMT